MRKTSRAFWRGLKVTRLTDVLRPRVQQNTSFAYIATVDSDIAITLLTCKSLGVSYEDVWFEKSQKNRMELDKATKRADKWWKPSWVGATVMFTPALLDMCAYGCVRVQSVAIAALVVLTTQTAFRSIGFNVCLKERIALDIIVERRKLAKN